MPLRQTAEREALKCQVKGPPQAPQSPSLAVPCPTDPGAEAAKDMRDRARAPRDSEVIMPSHQCLSAAHPPARPLF